MIVQEKIFEVPEGITTEVSAREVKMMHNNKTISRRFKMLGVNLRKEGNKIRISSKKIQKKKLAVINAVYSHLQNMVDGLVRGYLYKMEIVYSHFPMNVSVKGSFVEINNLAGGKNPRKAKIVGDTKVEIKGKDVFVKGIDREAVGQTCANIERATKLRGRDVRIFQDGIYLVEKGLAGLGV